MMEDSGLKQTGETTGVWRTLDASANRCAEALRVLEDALRFALEDAHLARELKAVRHDLAVVLAQEELRQRQRLRDVSGDVGAGMPAPRTPARTDLAGLVAANAARGAQALRSLEETSRVVVPQVTAAFEALRYRLYTLERAALTAVTSRDSLADVRLCVLVEIGATADGFAALIADLLTAGVGMIQLRDKATDLPQLCCRATAALSQIRRHAESTGQPRCLLIINDRVDVAVATGADGVHLGDTDLPLPLARRVAGPRLLVGRTAHTIEEARQAVLEGADYLGVGPCFPSATKDFSRFAPESFLRSVADEISLPAFAIGGITPERIDQLLALGLKRIAVAHAVTSADAPRAAAQQFSQQLTAHLKPPTASVP